MVLTTATRFRRGAGPCSDCGGLRDYRSLRCQPCHLAYARSRFLPLEARFWAKVDRRGPDECWPWIAATDSKGYGKIISGPRLLVATHVALALAGRPVPAGLLSRHTCDNPPCVNPAHLLIGTHADNHRDMVERDRSASPLTRPHVAAIKRALVEGASRKHLAESYGVCKGTIDHIAQGRSWSHVEPAEAVA